MVYVLLCLLTYLLYDNVTNVVPEFLGPFPGGSFVRAVTWVGFQMITKVHFWFTVQCLDDVTSPKKHSRILTSWQTHSHQNVS